MDVIDPDVKAARKEDFTKQGDLGNKGKPRGDQQTRREENFLSSPSLIGDVGAGGHNTVSVP